MMQNNKRRQADRRAVCGFIGSCKSATSENKCKTRTSLASDDNYKQIKRRKRTEIRTTRTTTSGNLVSFSIGAAILLLVPVILIKPDHCQCLETPKDSSLPASKLIRFQASGSHHLDYVGEPSDGDTDDDANEAGHLRHSESVSPGAGREPTTGANQRPEHHLWQPTNEHRKQQLQIVRLFAPEAVQNGTQNVTLDCMFHLDKRKDQRLTIKWFFEDELEPIYQWIPELNKRVYSDKYERFLDKNYQVTEDVDFMLAAYKSLFHEQANDTRQVDVGAVTTSAGPASSHELLLDTSGTTNNNLSDELPAIRKLLANRLNRHAKLGSEYSRQFLESLKRTFAMDQLEFSRFRALRLIRPTTELSGRFTCSISSLDSDDLRSTNLIVYEPAKSFTFSVTRGANHAYNLTCQAGPAFPRPTLALFRYRAAALDSQQHQQQQQVSSRPKLAATTLRQEPIAGTQTQITISARQPPDSSPRETGEVHHNNADNELFTDASSSNQLLSGEFNRHSPMEATPNSPEPMEESASSWQRARPALDSYDISAWALIDENSLSGNLVTQFECVLTIEGANYEQRQSLALQKGWHVNSSALTARSTLVGLFSALASLLCLILALVSSMLIFKLLRRHANQRRIHQAKEATGGGGGAATMSVAKVTTRTSGGSSSSSSNNSANTPTTTTDGNQSDCSTSSTTAPNNNNKNASVDNPGEPQYIRRTHPHTSMGNNVGHYNVPIGHHTYQADQQQQVTSDGIYRVPANETGSPNNSTTFGTRFVIGGHQQPNYQRQWQQHQQQYGHLNLGHQPANDDPHPGQYVTPTGTTRHLMTPWPQRGDNGPRSPPLPATISVNGRALYC